MEPNKAFFAAETKARTLADAMKGADVFIGLSGPNVVSPEMLMTMAKEPIVFALANPDPEIAYPAAREARPDAILATGRSDYPNQINNVLGFPFIFRGALDVRAREINEPMKQAATRALAKLAKEDVPDEVLQAYGVRTMRFGRDYIIPTPFDPRVLLNVSPAVAQAAIDTGVARLTTLDIDAYRDTLAASQSMFHEASRRITRRARKYSLARIVFPEARNETILRACHQIVAEDICKPILVGDEMAIRARAKEGQISLEGVEIVDNRTSALKSKFAQALFQERQRKGLDLNAANLIMDRSVEFGLMMVKMGQADGFVGGITRSYPEIIRPALQIIGTQPGSKRVSGFYMLLYPDRTLFLADTTVNEQPDAETLAEIAINTAKAARFFGIQPKVAMLSYSNFGSVRNEDTVRMTDAIDIVRQRERGLAIDGEMQAHLALNEVLRKKDYPFSTLEGSANVLVFPNLFAANTAYRLLSELSEAEIIGPILMGMAKPVNVLSQEALVQDVVNMTSIAVLESQEGVI
jgi:malate dehydrogenase (oxaloacetate-decarboxylating)(NADP+)